MTLKLFVQPVNFEFLIQKSSRKGSKLIRGGDYLLTITLVLTCAVSLRGQGPRQTPAQVQNNYEEYLNKIEHYFNDLIARSPYTREKFWNRDFTSIGRYLISVEPDRQRLIDMIGGFQHYARTPLSPQVERIGESEAYTIDRVRIGALAEVEANGILLIPKGVKGKSPVVIIQHGLGGSPESIAGLVAEDDSYHKVGKRLAERGFIVWANRMTQGVDTKSHLDRKAKMVGQRLQAIEQWILIRVVDYLQTRAEVLPDKIAIYGKSWGGRTAMYAGAIDERIATVVVTGHFNQTVPKMLIQSPHYDTYIDSNEDYAFFPNVANEFSDSDVASLICPRPFFVEQGKRDRVVYSPMAEQEFEIVRGYYRTLGIEDRAEIEFFDGEHEIHGERSFKFLEKWLLGEVGIQ